MVFSSANSTHSCSAGQRLGAPWREAGVRPRGQNRALVLPGSARALRPGEDSVSLTHCPTGGRRSSTGRPGVRLLSLASVEAPEILSRRVLPGNSEMSLVSAEVCSASGPRTV